MYSILNTAYNFCQLIHIISGFLITFITIPMNFLSRKGGVFHRKNGKLTLLLIFFLVSSSLFMLINPVFPNHFAKIANEFNWTGFFQNNFYEPLFFLWLDFFTLYLILSAIRVWLRVTMINQGKKHYNLFDIILAIILFMFSIFFIVTGLFDLKHHHPFASILIVEGIKMLVLVILDIVTFLKVGKWLLVEYGWILHGGKMLLLWHGLITAFMVRYTFKELGKFSILVQISYIVIALILFFSFNNSKAKVKYKRSR